MWLGVVLAGLAVAVATAVIYPLKSLAPAVSLSVVYLPAVLLVSAYWGLALGLATSLASAARVQLLPHLAHRPVHDLRRAQLGRAGRVRRGRRGGEHGRRPRPQPRAEAERRREEADLAAGLARELLAGAQTSEVLGSTARRLAEAMTLPSAAIELGAVPPEPRRLAMALRGPDGEQVATLLVGSHLPPETIERLREHVVGPLGALVAIALHRDAVQAEAVETAALRRSDDVKTALLRAVSHDLRTPLTAILAAGHALGTDTLTGDERDRAELRRSSTPPGGSRRSSTSCSTCPSSRPAVPCRGRTGCRSKRC